MINVEIPVHDLYLQLHSYIQNGNSPSKINSTLLLFVVAGITRFPTITGPMEFFRRRRNANSSGCHIGYARLVAKRVGIQWV